MALYFILRPATCYQTVTNNMLMTLYNESPNTNGKLLVMSLVSVQASAQYLCREQDTSHASNYVVLVDSLVF